MRAPDLIPAFFFPDAETPEKAEERYRAVVSAMRHQGYTLSDRRIFSIAYSQDEQS